MAAAVCDEFAAVPSCHGSVPNRYAAKAPCSGITIAIRNNSLAHFSRAAPDHFSRALKGSRDYSKLNMDALIGGHRASVRATRRAVG